jgi:hypothetical protein
MDIKHNIHANFDAIVHNFSYAGKPYVSITLIVVKESVNYAHGSLTELNAATFTESINC